jgi:membrane-bound lytic murein transglycosylase D
MMCGRGLRFPPDLRANVKKRVDAYAARIGNGVTQGPKEDMRFVLARGRTWAPRLTRTFADEGVPQVVALYLPMIESAYDPNAVSPMGARGMFQMLPATARRYGADPDRLGEFDVAAPLAARYVRAGMDEFASDPMRVALAVAAYNRGPRDIRKYLSDVAVLDDAEAEARFWAFVSNTAFGGGEAAETPAYVSSFFAAAVVGENPGAFGLDTRPLSSYTDARAAD